jgi:hypothetical protein
MHISVEAVTIGWMIPSGTNNLPAVEQTDYHINTLSYNTCPIFTVWFILWNNEVDYGKVVYELRIMEHVTSTHRMVAYGYLWLYSNCATQGQLIIQPQQGRWTWLMAVLVSLQSCVTKNPLDTTSHNQLKFKKKW